MAKNSTYQMDFPNWGINNVQTLKSNLEPPKINQFPFNGQGVNADYGQFYQKGIHEN